MDGSDIGKLIGQGGIAAAALLVLGKLVWMIGVRIVAAIDALRGAVVAFTAALGEVRQDLAILLDRRARGSGGGQRNNTPPPDHEPDDVVYPRAETDRGRSRGG